MADTSKTEDRVWRGLYLLVLIVIGVGVWAGLKELPKLASEVERIAAGTVDRAPRFVQGFRIGDSEPEVLLDEDGVLWNASPYSDPSARHYGPIKKRPVKPRRTDW